MCALVRYRYFPKHYNIVIFSFQHRQGQLPTGIKDRDLLQYMWVKKDERTDITRTFVILKAATHPKCPEQKGYIRYVDYNYCSFRSAEYYTTSIIIIYVHVRTVGLKQFMLD